MKLRSFIPFFFFLTLLFIPSIVFADTLVMKNGDRLTGEVQIKEGDFLMFKTAYGEFKIDWHEVASLDSDKPMKVLSEDDFSVTETSKIDESSPYIAGKPRARKYTINPEPWRLGEGMKFSGRVNVGLQYNRGNTDTDETDADANLELRDIKNRYNIFGIVEDDESEGITTKKMYNVRADYDRFVTQKTYLTALTSYEKDELAELDRRMKYGGGVGYQVFDDKKKKLSFELGPVWVDEEFTTGEEDDYWGAGWLVNYEQELITDSLQFYHRQEGTWNLEETDEILLDAWFGLRSPIYGGIVGSGEFVVKYDSDPATGSDDTDTQYGLKLGYEW